MGEVFEVTSSDKRKEFVSGILDAAQKPYGKDVEYFSDETGFVLLRKLAKIGYGKAFVQRAQSAAQLSQGVPLELREFYYTLVRASPTLRKPFEDLQAKAFYPAVLRAIMDLEILCDVPRESFTVGNLSKGFIFYYHSPVFGQKERKIAFTEVIARTIMKPEKEEEWQCSNCENIIVVEKNAAATRLVELGFSELTNSMIVTVGGNFSRAIWVLADRFKKDKHMIFLADADAFGVDMLRTIKVGTESSRHLSFKFPPAVYPKIHLAGFYPSIGETLGLANDIEEKCPMSNPHARQRMDFLVKYGLLDPQDLETWKRNKSYELESLSTGFKNEKGEPIGLAIYLIEYMRHFQIPIKPPVPPDEKLKEEFDKAAKEELAQELFDAANTGIPAANLYYLIHDFFDKIRDEIIKRLYEKLLPDFEKVLKEVGPKEIKYHIYKQYASDPARKSYDLKEIARKLKPKFEVKVHWDTEEFENAVQEALEEWKDEHYDSLRNPPVDTSTDILFAPIHNETARESEYDLVLQRLGAKEEDILKVREAIKRRFASG